MLLCWLFAGVNAKSCKQQAGGEVSCIESRRCLQLGHTALARPGHWCSGHAVTLLLKEERERHDSQKTAAWCLSRSVTLITTDDNRLKDGSGYNTLVLRHALDTGHFPGIFQRGCRWERLSQLLRTFSGTHQPPDQMSGECLSELTWQRSRKMSWKFTASELVCWRLSELAMETKLNDFLSTPHHEKPFLL